MEKLVSMRIVREELTVLEVHLLVLKGLKILNENIINRNTMNKL
jgi:hypothetical protein